MDQLNICSPAVLRSLDLAEAIRPYIDAILPSFNLSPRHISFELLLKDKDKPNEKIIGRSIRFAFSPSPLLAMDEKANASRNSVICRIKDQVRVTYLEFPADRANYYSSFGEIIEVGSSGVWMRINLDPHPNISALASAICADIKDLLMNFPSDFGCCDLYEQCSEAGRCIIKNQDLSVGCYYKKSLMRGNAFYKNTDGGTPHDTAAISDPVL